MINMNSNDPLMTVIMRKYLRTHIFFNIEIIYQLSICVIKI